MVTLKRTIRVMFSRGRDDNLVVQVPHDSRKVGGVHVRHGIIRIAVGTVHVESDLLPSVAHMGSSHRLGNHLRGGGLGRDRRCGLQCRSASAGASGLVM